jgi:hypothetical protein
MAPKKVWQQFFFPPLSSHCYFWIRDPGPEIRDPVWEKIRIRNKHPGSATLKKCFPLFNLSVIFHLAKNWGGGAVVVINKL